MAKRQDLGKAVPLSSNWSGHYMTDLEKTATGAIALGTVSPEAISDLTGLKKNAIKTFLVILEETQWDLHEALDRVNDDRQGNLVSNQEAYPILLQKGVVA